jgi:hypothetical protein
MPIKGTRPLGAADDLRGSEKDNAEHVMIVDLERNDLSRVCEPGSVRWPDFLVERELAGVVHMVTTVEGRLRADVSLAELLAAAFPGGSVTGAPKISAVDHIAALEPVGRGASMGALGRVYPNGDLDLALTIRTFAVADGRIHLWVVGQGAPAARCPHVQRGHAQGSDPGHGRSGPLFHGMTLHVLAFRVRITGCRASGHSAFMAMSRGQTPVMSRGDR